MAVQLLGCACTKPTGLSPASWDSQSVKFVAMVFFIGHVKPQWEEVNQVNIHYITTAWCFQMFNGYS